MLFHLTKNTAHTSTHPSPTHRPYPDRSRLISVPGGFGPGLVRSGLSFASSQAHCSLVANPAVLDARRRLTGQGVRRQPVLGLGSSRLPAHKGSGRVRWFGGEAGVVVGCSPPSGRPWGRLGGGCRRVGHGGGVSWCASCSSAVSSAPNPGPAGRWGLGGLGEGVRPSCVVVLGSLSSPRWVCVLPSSPLGLRGWVITQTSLGIWAVGRVPTGVCRPGR